VTAGDDETGRGLEQLPYCLPVWCNDRSFLRAPGRVELLLRCRDSHEVPFVDEAYDSHRVILGRPEGAWSLTGALHDGVHRSKGVIDLHEVELLKFVENRTVNRLGPRKLAVAFEDVEPATVQLEVDAPPRQQPLQFLVV